MKVEINNKKAYYEYFFEATYTAGLVLQGTEIKSLRSGKASFNDRSEERRVGKEC